MKNRIMQHFGHRFALDVNRRAPTKATDRLGLWIVAPGIAAGCLLAALGLYEFFCRGSSANPFPFAEIEAESFLSPTFFDGCIVVLGAWIALRLLALHIRYRKIFFNGKTVRAVTRDSFGHRTSFEEPIANYNGVLFRIEFFQFGLLNRNKYILELSHRNPEKAIPLYISTSGKKIRQLWEAYAKKLKLPALEMTEGGIAKRNADDLGKSLAQLAKLKRLKVLFNKSAKVPRELMVLRKGGQAALKVRGIAWDALALANLAITSIVIVSLALVLLRAAASGAGIPATAWYGFLLALAASHALMIFRKDKIILKNNRIVVIRQYPLFLRRRDDILKRYINTVDVAFDPKADRHFLVISGEGRTLTFGKKLPVAALKWAREFLISEIA